MRHVPIAEFKDRLSEVVAAAAAGEEVVITRHGRDVVKLVAVEHDVIARRRAAIQGLYELGQRVRKDHGPTTHEEIRSWIDEGKRWL